MPSSCIIMALFLIDFCYIIMQKLKVYGRYAWYSTSVKNQTKIPIKVLDEQHDRVQHTGDLLPKKRSL